MSTPLKHQKHIDAFHAMLREPWMDALDFAAIIAVLRAQPGTSDREIDEAIENGVQMGFPVESQLRVLRLTSQADPKQIAELIAKYPFRKPNLMPTNPNDPHIILDKELRRDIDAIIQRLKEASNKDSLGPIRTSRERSLAITKLQEAVMWLDLDEKAIQSE